MDKILFIVETPFQLLSAMEAKNYFHNYKSVLLIRYFPERTSSLNNNQIKKMLTLTEWFYIETIECNLSTKISNYKLFFYMKKLQKKYTTFNKIFIGEYRSWIHRKYLEILNPQESFLLDDGSVSIEIQKNYLPKYKNYFEGTNLMSRLDRTLRTVMFKLLDIRERKLNINLFTCFDLTPYSNQQKIINHQFDFSKKLLKRKAILSKTVYFFGSPLSEVALISEEYELDLLNKIVQRFKNNQMQLVYLPHRREKKEKLDKITNRFNVELRISKYPAEIEFIMMESIPSCIASFYSTTLISIPKIVNFKEIISFQLDYTQINSDWVESIQNIYDYYKQKLEVIDINES